MVIVLEAAHSQMLPEDYICSPKGGPGALKSRLGRPGAFKSSSIQDLPTERAAGRLSKHFTCWWLEKQGYGRVLIDSDGL